MPVRSFNSSIFKWPDRELVLGSVKAWAHRLARDHPELTRAGFFGSYARGDWGVHSDVDLILIVRKSESPFWQRSLEWNANDLPVPADILVYTEDEWLQIAERGGRFFQTIQKEAIWVYER